MTENRGDLFLSDNLSKEDNIMSRIGRLPVAIPAGVEVSVAAGNVVTVKGPKEHFLQKWKSKLKMVM